jgi:hypothetical protein
MRFFIANAAGPAAQALHMRGTRSHLDDETSWKAFDGGQDFARAVSLMTAAKRLLTVNLETIPDEAFDLLEQLGIWSAVGHVAQDLLRFGELDYQGIYDAVHVPDAIQRPPVERKTKRQSDWSRAKTVERR